MAGNYKKFHELSELELQGYCEAIDYTRKFYSEKFNLEIFICYGTLLGSVRQNDFIPHDYDVDLSYISQEKKVNQVAVESSNILAEIINGNIPNVTFYSGNLAQYKFHVKNDQGSFVIEIFVSYILDNNFYHYYTLTGQLKIESVLPLENYKLRSFNFLGPSNYDQYLISQYGKNWSIPDPSFSEDRTEINFKPFMPFLPQNRLGYWNKFYSKKTEFVNKPCITANEIVSHLVQNSKLLDFGCGMGLEANYFTEFVDYVIGLDYSGKAIEIANEKFKDNKNLSFEKLSILGLTNFKRFIRNHNKSFDIIYCAHLLDVIDQPTENVFFVLIKNLLKQSGHLFLKVNISETEEEDIIKVNRNKYLRIHSFKKLKNTLVTNNLKFEIVNYSNFEKKNIASLFKKNTKQKSVLLDITY